MLHSLKRIVPVPIKNYVKRSLLKIQYKRRKFRCPVCNKKVLGFEPLDRSWLEVLDSYGYIHSIFGAETCNLFNYSCPSCQCSDRSRLYAIYLEEAFKNCIASRNYKFIDFGPDIILAKLIKKKPFINYRSADLFMEGVDDRVDITDMKIYTDNSVDIFLCSHVLEHVDDDRKAMKELYRILAPGGWGIAMVPILLTLDTIYENPAITSEADRWKHFGQNDHTRLYSKRGFVNRLEEAGFKVNQLDINYFGEKTFKESGIHDRSVLYVVEK